jgi:hypothetical protein
MNLTIQKTYVELEKIATEVKKGLHRKGIAIPTKLKDGTVSVEGYRIIKDSSGFYTINDKKDRPVVTGINLPQTAALLANDLALGRWMNTDILKQDINYGYKLFEETLAKVRARKSLKKNDIDRAGLMFTRYEVAHAKTNFIKQQIVLSFEKLRRLR